MNKLQFPDERTLMKVRKLTKRAVPYMKRYRYYLVGGLCVVLLAGLGLYWRAQQAGPAAGAEASPDAAAGGKGDTQKYVQIFRVKAVRFQDVLPGLMGTVRGASLELKGAQDEKLTAFHFKSGDFVKRGQMIAEQDHTRTRARMRQAEINLKRRQSLFDVGGASRVEVDEAREVLNIARKDYEDTYIAAPKDGYVGEILLQEGELVSRQTPVMYFVSTEDSFCVETSVIERRVREIKAEQPAKITVDSLPGVEITGRVMSVAPEVTTTSRMAPVRIRIPAEYRGKLRPGLSAVCSIVLYDRHTPVIPKTALVGDKERVYVVDASKKIHARDIRLGYESRDYVEVLEGLQEEELVVNRPDYAGIQEDAQVRFGQPEEYKEGK